MTAGPAIELAPGLRYHPGYLGRDLQVDLLDQVRAVIAVAPLFQPRMPKSGAPFSVRMTNSGVVGWLSDRDGYRYSNVHPVTGKTWPSLPLLAADAWRSLSDYSRPPEACLINYYEAGARMGLHQDRDEEGFVAPVVSLSLGDTCIFRFGGIGRRDPTKSLKLHSGDALVLAGSSRLAFHGVDRIIPGSSTLLTKGGRFNLTLRRISGEPLGESSVS